MKSKSIFYLFLIGISITHSIIISCVGNTSKSEELKNKLIGKWGGLGEKSPVFKITSDSIYYYDRLKSYKYEILSGDMIISFPESKGFLKRVSVINDTMFFFDEFPDTIRAYRFAE